MNIRSKKLWAGTLATTAVAATSLAVATTSAPADSERRGDPVISMEFDGMSPPRFEGPNKIFEGQSLRVINNTSPKTIGPHTFTLIEKSLIPETKKEAKACFKGESKVCKRIFKAHQVDFQNETVGKPLVERGEEGWDVEFNEKDKGDSWFTSTEDEELTQSVPLDAGEKFAYFCVVHPEMAGKLKVVPAR